MFRNLTNSSGYLGLPGSCPDSDQIHLYTGNLLKQIGLFSIPTVGLPLSLTLYHNSLDRDFTGPVGTGWRHGGETRLERASALATTIDYRDPSGKPFAFELVSGSWKLKDDGNFMNVRLSSPASGIWHLETLPQGNILEFAEQPGGPPIEMRLVRCLDKNGNAVEYDYDGSGQLVAIRDAVSLRQISLEWSSGRLVGASDPKGNRYGLEYTGDLLSAVELPSGCRLEYAYLDERIVSRTDRDGASTLYDYDLDGRLVEVQEPEVNSLRATHSFTYAGTVEEILNTHADTFLELQEVHYTDPRSQVWTYRFNVDGTLWRAIDPLERHRRCYYDSNQQLLYSSEGYPRPYFEYASPLFGPFDNTNNRFYRYVTDMRGNRLQSIDPNGAVDVYTYDQDSRLTSVYPARAHLGVQGQWKEHFGSEGILLCAQSYTGDDIQQLPDYLDPIDPVLSGDGVSSSTEFSRANVDHNPAFTEDRAVWLFKILDRSFLDGIVPDEGGRFTEVRRAGYWFNESDDRVMAFRLQFSEPRALNLSLYTHNPEAIYSLGGALSQYEISGQAIQFEVTDLRGTQRFHCTQSASGCWVTFPVVADAEHPVLVRAKATYTQLQRPTISALAFDPYEDRGSYFEYDGDGNLVSQIEPSADPSRQMAMEYRYAGDGTLEEMEHIERLNGVVSQSRLSKYFYQDSARNLTRVEDPENQDDAPTLMEYDLNGNLLRLVDPDGRATRFEYDDRNRMVAVRDPLGNTTRLSYDGRGLLSQIEDPLERVTHMLYTPDRRLWKMIDAAGGVTEYLYLADGLLASVTDPRGHTVSFVYDDAGQRTGVLYPECEVVQADFSRAQLQPELRYAYDVWSRVVAVTSPNGNQDDLDQIQLLHALRVLRNPGAELESRTLRDGVMSWDSIPVNQTRSSESSTDGYSLPFADDGDEWLQRRIPSHPGGRYLMRADLKSTSADATVELRAVLRQLDGSLAEQSSGALATSNAWETCEWSRLDTLGQAQVTSVYPVIHQLRASADKPNSAGTVYLENPELVALSSHFHYDGLYPSAVTGPDGAQTLIYRDRWGRPVRTVDPDGRQVKMSYDEHSRLIHVEDSQGLSLSYVYDAWGNLERFIDSRAQETLFAYDDLNRLLSITQPVLSQVEEFSYSPAGDLLGYRNCRAEERQFFYDAAHRLVRIEYAPLDFISLSYDAAGNLKRLRERNGDVLRYSYDALNRPVLSARKSSTGLPTWKLRHQFDANGNRVALRQPASLYGSAEYGSSAYIGAGEPYWSTPVDGIDALNRRVALDDSLSQRTQMGYDIDGRLAELEQPNGTLSRHGYDVSGRLMAKTVSLSSSPLWVLGYAYNLASDRLGQISAWGSEGASYDYALDASGRLVRETVNRMVTWTEDDWAGGEPRRTFLDEDGVLRLLGYADDFRGQRLNLQRWEVVVDNGNQAANRLRQDDGLHLALVRGGHSKPGNGQPMGQINSWQLDDYRWPTANLTTFPSASDHSGETISSLYLMHRNPVSGEFQVELDLSDVQGTPLSVFLGATMIPWRTDSPQRAPGEGDYVRGRGGSILFYKWNEQRPVIYFNAETQGNVLTGRLRLERRLVSGNWKLIGSYFDGTSWQTLPNWTTDIVADDLTLYLGVHTTQGHGCVRLDDFRCDHVYPVSAVDLDEDVNQALWPGYESQTYDAGFAADWDAIRWVESLAANTDVRLQVAVSASAEGPWSYVGPDGTADSYFSTPGGEALPTLTGRYARFRAFLISTDGLATPELSQVQISHSGAAGSRLTCYGYDEAGNLLDIEKHTDLGVTTEIRTVNALNQILTRTGDWTYQYDANGCLTVKTNGTGIGDERWEFSWDEDNRLTSVTKGTYGVGGLASDFVVAYQYDSMGRMLTRDDGVAVTSFTWDSWDLLSETTDSVTTTYLVPDGQILSFIRDGDTYQLHTDALGSVRMVTDSVGDVVARFEYGAYGELLDGSFDSVGIPYRFVGSLGVRSDSVTGLLYMRHRWYDPELQRFVSRDPIGLRGGVNLYAYATNQPQDFIDPNGLEEGVLSNNAVVNVIKTAAGLAAGEAAAWGTAIMEVAPPTVLILAPAVGAYAAAEAGAQIVPGTSRGPYFGDTMGSDRFGSRRWDYPENREPRNENGSLEVPDWKIPPRTKPGTYNKPVRKPKPEGRGLTDRGNHDTPMGGQCVEKYRKCLSNVRDGVRRGELDRGFQGVHEGLCKTTLDACLKGCNYTPRTWYWPTGIIY